MFLCSSVVSFNSVIPRAQSFITVTQASDVQLRTIRPKCCSVVFGVKLRLLVIHFVVVFRHQQTTPLSLPATSVINSQLSVYCTWRTERSQHAMEPDIGSESRFLPTPPAFDAPVKDGGWFTSTYCHAVWYGKTRIVWLPGDKKMKICLFLLT